MEYSPGNSHVRIFHGYDGVFTGEYSMIRTKYSLVKSNFIFQGDPPHARIPWRIFHGYDGVFPEEYSIITTEYSLVKSNFIFQRDPPPKKNQPKMQPSPIELKFSG